MSSVYIYNVGLMVQLQSCQNSLCIEPRKIEFHPYVIPGGFDGANGDGTLWPTRSRGLQGARHPGGQRRWHRGQHHQVPLRARAQYHSCLISNTNIQIQVQIQIHDILVVNDDGTVDNITKFPLGPEHNIIPV